MDWNYIISFMGGSVAFFGAAAWLTRVLVTQLMLKDVEAYKAKLLSEYNLALEKFKSDLEKTNAEHQVRFSTLHEKRAEIIAALYNHIVETHSQIECCIEAFENESETPKPDLAQEALSRGDDLAEYVTRNRIYFSPSLANELEELYTCLIDTASYYQT